MARYFAALGAVAGIGRAQRAGDFETHGAAEAGTGVRFVLFRDRFCGHGWLRVGFLDWLLFFKSAPVSIKLGK
jgi:hypothetical protein